MYKSKAYETQQYWDHNKLKHTSQGIFQYVVANDVFDVNPPPGGASTWVRLADEALNGYDLITSDLRDPDHPWRHDPKRIEAVLIQLLTEHTGQSLNIA